MGKRPNVKESDKTGNNVKASDTGDSKAGSKGRMPEWKSITGRTGYIILDLSLVVTYDIDEKNTVLIDSGYSENHELIRFMRQQGRSVPAVLCTHFHVDHMGNNGLLQREMGTQVFASRRDIEIQRIRYESDDPISFEWMDKEKYHFGDSGKFESVSIEPGQGKVTILGTDFAVERLDGHSPDHLGFATPDGVLAIGDAFMSDVVLKKSKVPYEFDITKTLETLGKIKHMDYDFFAAAHMDVIPKEQIAQIIDSNIEYHKDMLDEIEQRLNGWQSAERFITEAIGNRGVNLRFTKSSGWLPLAVRSYLAHLIHEGRIVCSRTPSQRGIMDGLPDDPLDKAFYIKRAYAAG